MKKLIILFSILWGLKSNAQENFTISGIVKDKKTGEALIGSLITIEELKGIGTTADMEGNYKIKLTTGNYQLKASLLGYKPLIKTVQLNQNAIIDFIMEDEASELTEIVVSATKDEGLLASAGIEKLDMTQVNKIPVLMGERDVLKTIQLLPGVKGAGEGNSGFYVRGGTADQNLVLLDGAPVYNATHLFGMFSTFNSDVIKQVTLYKAGIPSSYGGRLSSVLDVEMSEGDKQNSHVSGSIGLISSKLSVETPIVKEKGSIILSGRRTYADLFLKLMPDEELNTKQLNFYDLNGKASYAINDKNRVYITSYYGRDNLKMDKSFGMNWGNLTSTIKWNHIYNRNLLSNTSFIFTAYDYKVGVKLNDANIELLSKIKTHTLNHEFKYIIEEGNVLQIGLFGSHHEFTPGQVNTTDNNIAKPLKLQNRYALDNALFVNHEWRVNEKLNFSYGVRVSAFSIKGSGDFYEYNRDGELISTKTFEKNKLAKTYINLEPRASVSFAINKNTSIKSSYTRNAQNTHLLSGSTSENPTDIWLPSSYNIKPEIADQFALGYFNIFKEGMFEISLESYYKEMQNQIDYRNGASVLANDKVEAELLYGKGRAYGFELCFKKKTGKLNGWVAYTLSRSERKIDGINNNQWYAAKQDRTHDISLVGIYDISKKWSVSATWVYNTGNAVTFPTGKYIIDGTVHFVYSDRNAERMPAYHRMDIGVTYTKKRTGKFESSWNFSIYNAYAHDNAYSITFEQDPNNSSRTQAIQTTLFKIIPSINYNFKF